MSIDETNDKETAKLPTFKKKGVKRKEQGEEGIRKSVVARCAYSRINVIFIVLC